MAKSRSPLCGTWGRVWLDGEEVGILLSIEATITNNYEDVQIGVDMDRRKVSQTGEGTLKFRQVNNITSKLAERYKNGGDPRFVIETNLKDPSAISSQQEGYTFNNVSFDSIPVVNMEQSALIEKELPFRFTVSDMQINDQIFDEE